MPTKYMVSALTASGDTTLTKIDEITMPPDCKMIIGFIVEADLAATLTTGEGVTGYVQFTSPSLSIAPCQIPLPDIQVLTSGAYARNQQIWLVNLPGGANAKIEGDIIMDMAQTGALKARFFVMYQN